jgi:hypothetical protein
VKEVIFSAVADRTGFNRVLLVHERSLPVGFRELSSASEGSAKVDLGK